MCRLHGPCNHTTDDCNTLRDLKKRGLTVVNTRTINQVREDDQEEEEINKISEAYYISTVNNCERISNNFSSINPCKIKANVQGNQISALLDTGADISLISLKNIPKNSPIVDVEDNFSLISASNDKIKCIGKIHGLKIVIDNNKYFIDIYITKNSMPHIILGINFIKKYPHILTQRLKPVRLDKSEKQNNQEKDKFLMQISINDIINQNQDIFKDKITPTTLCTKIKHHIETGEHKPQRQYNGRIPIHLDKAVGEEINKLLEQGVIVKSKSEWCSRLVPIIKENGSIRLCVDYRHINNITDKETYPLPHISDILDKLSKAKIFSIIDATTGYYQIALSDTSREKTAFTYQNIKYEFKRMPFGLCNAPSTFQALMDNTFSGKDRVFVLPYLDDIVIFSENLEKHIEQLQYVFLKLKAINLILNKNKCKFGKSELKILGNIVSFKKIKPDPQKIKALSEYQRPVTIKELRAFLGLSNQMRNFIRNFAAYTTPLNNLLKGETKRSVKRINWTTDTIQAFEETKRIITNITYRSQPDFSKDMILTTDASKDSIGAILSQKTKDDKEQVIYYFSRGMTGAEKNYSVTEKELLAVVKGMQHFRQYLIGKPFTLHTDHSALEYLTRGTELNSRLMRWALELQEYSYIPKYIKGENNPADGLSRQPNICLLDLQLTQNEKIQILSDYHKTSGHGSAHTMKFLLRDKYYWENQQQDIRNYIRGCLTCLKSGGLKRNTKNKVIRSSHINELWEVDLIGPIKGSEGENKFILVCVDHFSKWVEAFLINNKSAGNVTNKLRVIINKNGIPEEILSDNGKEFRNSEIGKLCTEYNIMWKYNSPDITKQ